MADLDIPFPNLDFSVRARWAPIFWRPITGSGEQFVIGVIAATSDDFVLARANRLNRLECLYGESAQVIIPAIEQALADLESDILKRSVAALEDHFSWAEALVIGGSYEAVGYSLQDIATQWISAMSSLYSTNDKDHLLDENESDDSQKQSSTQYSRVPVLVHDFVKDAREGLAMYFSARIREGKGVPRRGQKSKTFIHYSGPKIAANFGMLDGSSRSIDIIKYNLWDLKVERDVSANKLENRKFELMIRRPKNDNPEYDDKRLARISDALNELTQQADQEQLRLIPVFEVNEMGRRILAAEKAA